MFFTMPFVDVPMAEGPWDRQHPGRMDRFLRAVAYHKIWRYWNAWGPAGRLDGNNDPANVRAQFRHGLAYAIFPAVASVQSASGDLESDRALYRQYVPAIEELSRAGWEPVPYATADEGVIVERFGDAAQGELHFTLRNYADKPVETLLRPDWQALGCPEDDELVMLDILPGTPRLTPFPRQGCRLAIEADGSRAFWVGTAGRRRSTVSAWPPQPWKKSSGCSMPRCATATCPPGKRPSALPGQAPMPTKAAPWRRRSTPPPGRSLAERPEDRIAGGPGQARLPPQGASVDRSGGALGHRGPVAAGCHLRARRRVRSK